MSRTLVVTSPHISAYSAGNIDVSLLAGALAELDGVSVKPFSVRALNAGKYDVVHVHWPEWLIERHGSSLSARRSAWIMLRALRNARRCGTRIVWDANNVHPHEPIHRSLVSQFLHGFSELTDLFMASNGALADEFIREYPALMMATRAHLGNLNYVDTYPNDLITRTEARKILALPNKPLTALVFGVIRRYKNIPTLIDTFREFGSESHEPVHLIVAGAASDSDLRGEVEAAAQRAGGFITLRLGAVPEELVAPYFRAADVTLIGTSLSVKSSVSALSLSLGTPVWMPRRGAAIDFADEVEPPALNLYDGSVTQGVLRQVFKGLPAEALPRPRALLDGRLGQPWGDYATRVLTEYQRLPKRRKAS